MLSPSNTKFLLRKNILRVLISVPALFVFQFGGSEAIITALSDEYPIVKRRREIFVFGLFILYYCVGIMEVTQVRATVLQQLHFRLGNWIHLLIVRTRLPSAWENVVGTSWIGFKV